MFTLENYFLIGLFITSINTALIMPAVFSFLYQPTMAGLISNGVLWPLTLWRWVNYFLPSKKDDV